MEGQEGTPADVVNNGGTPAATPEAKPAVTPTPPQPKETPKAKDEGQKPAAPEDLMIPKHRFDELNTKNKELEARLAQYEQKPATDPTNDWETKYKELLKQNNEKEAAAAEARRRETIMRGIGEDVYDKAMVYGLLKLESIKVEGDKVEGMLEQIKELKKTKPFLFKPVAQIAKPAAPGQQPEKSLGKKLAGEVAGIAPKISKYFN